MHHPRRWCVWTNQILIRSQQAIGEANGKQAYLSRVVGVWELRVRKNNPRRALKRWPEPPFYLILSSSPFSASSPDGSRFLFLLSGVGDKTRRLPWLCAVTLLVEFHSRSSSVWNIPLLWAVPPSEILSESAASFLRQASTGGRLMYRPFLLPVLWAAYAVRKTCYLAVSKLRIWCHWKRQPDTRQDFQSFISMEFWS